MRFQLVLGACFFVLAGASSATAQEPMFKLQLQGRWIEGLPLLALENEVRLLARDGQIVQFDPALATQYSQSNGGFHSYSQAELRGQLLREYGAGFEVSGVGHYLVVHPVGQKNLWAPRFEELYRSFVHYFHARSFHPAEPRFPLIAVVFPRKADFDQQAAREKLATPQNMLGYYTPRSNRIYLYDVTAGGKTGFDWSINADTIIHEATHQTAFNVGMHNRFGQTPQWVCEGLATLFEAPGVWNSQLHHNLADRVNRRHLATFRRYLSRRGPSAIAEMVATDRLFQTDNEGAYAEAWALTFFLTETEPRKYVQFLTKAAGVKSFTEYSSANRLGDFAAVFGANFDLLDARMKRFLAELR